MTTTTAAVNVPQQLYNLKSSQYYISILHYQFTSITKVLHECSTTMLWISMSTAVKLLKHISGKLCNEVLPMLHLSTQQHLRFFSPSDQHVQIIMKYSYICSRLYTINILVSSANFKMQLFIPMSKSLTKMKNKIGPSTDPWGTPLSTSSQSDSIPLTQTRWTLFFSHCVIQERSLRLD